MLKSKQEHQEQNPLPSYSFLNYEEVIELATREKAVIKFHYIDEWDNTVFEKRVDYSGRNYIGSVVSVIFKHGRVIGFHREQ